MLASAHTLLIAESLSVSVLGLGLRSGNNNMGAVPVYAGLSVTIVRRLLGGWTYRAVHGQRPPGLRRVLGLRAEVTGLCQFQQTWGSLRLFAVRVPGLAFRDKMHGAIGATIQRLMRRATKRSTLPIVVDSCCTRCPSRWVRAIPWTGVVLETTVRLCHGHHTSTCALSVRRGVAPCSAPL